MPPSSVFLVGTVHRSAGYRRLLDLLTELGPDAITLEMSPYALSFRLRHGASLLERLEAILDTAAAETVRPRDALGALPQVEAIRALLALPLEYAAAADYAAGTGISLHLIDSSLISARKLRRVEQELVSLENVRTLVELAPEEPVENPRIARAMIREGADPAVRRAFLAPRRGSDGIGDRDRRMAAVIRSLNVGTVVHIGGWVHLMEDEMAETLYERLRDLRPERMLLA